MSETVYWVVLGCALALAAYSVRVTIMAEPATQRRRWCVLGSSAALGVLLGGWALGWDSWPAGLVAGLAVVELGPAVLQWVRAKIGWDRPDDKEAP